MEDSHFDLSTEELAALVAVVNFYITDILPQQFTKDSPPNRRESAFIKDLGSAQKKMMSLFGGGFYNPHAMMKENKNIQ